MNSLDTVELPEATLKTGIRPYPKFIWKKLLPVTLIKVMPFPMSRFLDYFAGLGIKVDLKGELTKASFNSVIEASLSMDSTKIGYTDLVEEASDFKIKSDLREETVFWFPEFKFWTHLKAILSVQSDFQILKSSGRQNIFYVFLPNCTIVSCVVTVLSNKYVEIEFHQMHYADFYKKGSVVFFPIEDFGIK
jgi:hypothetical protein